MSKNSFVNNIYQIALMDMFLNALNGMIEESDTFCSQIVTPGDLVIVTAIRPDYYGIKEEKGCIYTNINIGLFRIIKENYQIFLGELYFARNITASYIYSIRSNQTDTFDKYAAILEGTPRGIEKAKYELLLSNKLSKEDKFELMAMCFEMKSRVINYVSVNDMKNNEYVYTKGVL